MSRPKLGYSVLVRTRQAIDGQHEHAGVVTKVYADDTIINVMLLPPIGEPYPIGGVPHVEGAPEGATVTWRLSGRGRASVPSTP